MNARLTPFAAGARRTSALPGFGPAMGVTVTDRAHSPGRHVPAQRRRQLQPLPHRGRDQRTLVAWSIAKFGLPGRSVPITLIDLPFSASPVISGLIRVLLLAPKWLKSAFAVPGIVPATMFVTFSFFAVTSLLALLGLATLVIKTILEWRYGAELAATRHH
jgi:hypothetical protein